MARLTIEDCLEKIDNRYELVLLASKRAKQLAMGNKPLIEEESGKPIVIALREIAAGLVYEGNIDEFGHFAASDEAAMRGLKQPDTPAETEQHGESTESTVEQTQNLPHTAQPDA